MNQVPEQNDLLHWALILAIGFPILEIGIGEFIHNLERRNSPLASTLKNLRNLVIPTFAILLFLKNVLKLEAGNNQVKLVETLFWIFLLYSIISLINAVLFAGKKDENSWQARIPKLFRDLARFILVLMGTALVLSFVWDIDLAGLITALGVGSIVLGFALQDSIGSIFSGIMLLFERPFHVGDWLKVGEISGQVTDMNWRSVHIETEERYLVVLPHLYLAKEVIHNYSRPFLVHEHEIQMRFSFDHPPNLVKQVLKAAALSTPGVLSDPAPEIETKDYAEYGILYNVVIYMKDFGERDNISDEFRTRVWYAAKRYNLRIPYPTREVYQVDTARQDTVASEFTKNLQSMPVLIGMESESLESIAQGAILHNFAAGEVVIKEGDRVKALHLIIAGKAALSVTDELGKNQEILTIERGEFFGETAMFTGEPSKVTITAVEDLEVILIYAEMANMMVERQPSLAREIGQVMEARRKAVIAAKQKGTNRTAGKSPSSK